MCAIQAFVPMFLFVVFIVCVVIVRSIPIDLTINQNFTVTICNCYCGHHPLSLRVLEYGQAIHLLLSLSPIHPYHGPPLSWTAQGPPNQFFYAV